MKKDNFLEFQICSENKFNHKDLFSVNGSITLDLNENVKKNMINLNLKVI